eukprot:TRINITY_DN1498_c0_g1_i6.p1 TRINITY_DN1498_c0_g1~~TRINITY_DN1498_c0_g1_i6.p1  ORF type:complete len:226 (-),score=70.88 TRINITY_DN1498_c0_g1_i6:124-801(-)
MCIRDRYQRRVHGELSSFLTIFEMRLISIYLLKWNEETPFILDTVHELSFLSFFQRPFFKEHLNFGARTCVARAKPGEKTVVEIKEANALCYCNILPNGLSGVAITDNEYPPRVAFMILNEAFNEFLKMYKEDALGGITKDTSLHVPRMDEMVRVYQDPKEADKLMKIEKELVEVTSIVHKTMEDLLKRGETLESLMAKSKDVSGVSLDFYKKSRQANKKCCGLY